MTTIVLFGQARSGTERASLMSFFALTTRLTAFLAVVLLTTSARAQAPVTQPLDSMFAGTISGVLWGTVFGSTVRVWALAP